MPQIFKIGSYWVFFLSNESDPLEPVHVHVCQGAPNGNATKIWITRAGNATSVTTGHRSLPIRCIIS